MSKTAVKKEERNLELELMEEKLKNLEAQITKPQSSEEAFQARVKKYEDSKPQREALAKQIKENQMRLQQEIPKARFEEIKILEAWKRRAESLKTKDPNAAARFNYEYKVRVKQINQDPMR